MRASIIEGCTSAPDTAAVVVVATASFDFSENGRGLASGGDDDINAFM